MDKLITGIDIGGTHISVCVADVGKGKLLNATLSREHLNPTLSAGEIIDQWCKVIRNSHDKAGSPITKIGIAMPGPFDYEKGICLIKGLNKYDQLYGLNVKELLAAELNILPGDIRMINDASAFLMGELSGGAGIGYKNVVGITLGTGLGSASFYNDHLHEGDLWCMPYLDSRAEDYACSQWLVKNYEDRTGYKLHGVKEIAERVPADAEAKQAFIEYGRNLAAIFIQRYSDQHPQSIVIGGNIAKAWEHFIPATTSVLMQRGFSWKLLPALLGEEAALLGAACLW